MLGNINSLLKSILYTYILPNYLFIYNTIYVYVCARTRMCAHVCACISQKRKFGNTGNF